MRRVGAYLLLALGGCLTAYLQSFAAPIDEKHQQEVQAALRSAPLAFERNAGATDANARYVVHGFSIGAGFSSNTASFLLPVGHRTTRLEMSFGGRSAQIVGEQELPGKTNYFRSNDPAQWRTGLANFARIRYQRLWPGIDLVFYGNGEHLEHDFVVAPGAAPELITFNIDGAKRIELRPNGDLIFQVDGGEINFKKPVAYQQIDSSRRKVNAAFKLKGNRVSFELGRYDHRRTLTIDPVLVFSTDLAGSTFEHIAGMAVDAQGNIYVAGDTFSPDFPTTPGSVQPVCAVCSAITSDAFVTKLNPTGSALVYSTFLGGTAEDFPQSIVVDGSGNAIVAGVTESADFPAVNPIGTFSSAAGFHLFISSLSSTGATLNYSGVVGPLVPPFSFTTVAPAISLAAPLALDSSGNTYVATQTLFSSFPTTPSAIASVPPNPIDAVLVALKVSAAGSLVYSTAIPGRATPAIGSSAFPGPNTFFQNAIAVDSTGSAYVAGQANDGLPTTLGVIGPAFVSDSGFAVFFPQEGFLLKLNPAGSALAYATYIPATSRVNTMRVDAGGNAYLGGGTSSPSLAISPNAFRTDTGCAGCQVGYLLKVNPQATATLGGTYLHGAQALNNTSAQVEHIALDANGNVFVTGIASGTMPTVNPLAQTFNDGRFIIQMSSDFSTLLFSSFGPDALIEIAPSGKIVLASDNGFPTTPGAFQTTPPPGRDGTFSLPNIAAIDLTVPAPAVCLNTGSLSFGFGVIAPGTTSAPQSATVTNCGNADLHISSVASDSPNYSVTTSCVLSPAAIAPGSSCTVSATYSPVNYQNGAILITDDALLSPHFVSLSGAPKAPFTVISPSSLSFPETPLTTSTPLGMQIADGGFTDLTVSSMSTTGDFSVSQRCLGTLPPPSPGPVFPPNILHPCFFTVSFVPTNTGTRTGTLIVNDNSLDSPHIIQLSGLAIAAWPTPILANSSSVNVAGMAGNVANSPGSAQTLTMTGGGFSRLTTATLDGLIFDNNNRLMKIVSPQQIDLTLADNDFGDVGEAQVQAITPTPGGGTSNAVATITSPIKFYDFTARQVEFVVSGSMVVGPKSGLIYDAVGNTFLEAPNIPVPSVAVIDPVQERLISGLVNFPNRATVLAISDDEQFLYASIPGSNAVAQISLPSGTINFMASLGKDPALGNYSATSIRVMPGHPHTWVAALQPVSATKPIALKVFDDAVRRTNTVEQGNATSIFPGKLLFVGNDITTVYSIDSTSLYRFTIDANGVTLRDKTAGLGAEDFDTDGTLLYLSTGAIIDPGTLLNKGNFNLATGLPVHAVAVDGTTGRAIFAGDATSTPGNGSLVQGFDTGTLAAKGSFTMPKLSGVNSLLRWGTNGLAFGIVGGPVTITRSSVTGNSGLLAPFHIGALDGEAPIGTAQVSAGSPAVFNLGILGVNGFNGPVTLSCSNLPQSASCSFSQNPVTFGGGPFRGAFVIVTISTHQTTTASAAPAHSYMRSGTGFILLTAVLSLPFALAAAGRRGKLLALCLLIAIIGCGGGQAGGPTPTPVISPTPAVGSNRPAGIYTVILTGTSASGTRHAVLQMIVL
jgi:hypothetical protein